MKIRIDTLQRILDELTIGREIDPRESVEILEIPNGDPAGPSAIWVVPPTGPRFEWLEGMEVGPDGIPFGNATGWFN